MNVVFRVLLPFFLLSAIQLSAQDSIIENSEPQSPVTKYDPAHVIFEGDTLFQLFSSLGSYTPRERARNASLHLEELADDMYMVEDSFNIEELTNYSVIRFKEKMIVTISDEDAEFYDLTRQEAAEFVRQTIYDAFVNHIEKKSFSEWAIRIGYTLLTLVGLFIIFYLINRFFRWINTKLTEYEKGLKRKRRSLFKYLAPKGPDYFFVFVSRIVKLALIIIILFLYLPLLFSFLPWTKKIVEDFYGYITDPIMYILTGLYNFLPNLFFIAIIVIIARYVVRVITYIAGEIEQDKLQLKGFHKDWAHPTLNIVRVLIYAFALVFIFPYLPGSDSPAFQGISIFLGVLLSLGSTSAIANIVAGIVITYMRPFMIGDRVMIGGTVGDVVEKTLLVTKIRTVKNEDVTIPNATIINGQLFNYTKNASELGIILHPKVTIGYDVPSDQVIKLLLAAAKNTKNLTRDFKPFVLVRSLNDFYVEYELNVYTKQPSKMLHFYSELNQNIKKEFNAAGVEIVSPHYHAYRDGNASTIPGKAEPPPNPVEDVIQKVTGTKKKGS